MLQKSRSKTIAKLKYLVLVPVMLLMLTYVACSEDKTIIEENTSELNSQQDAALKAALWEEITAMDAGGTGFPEISDVFLIEKDAHIKSKEAYYRMQVFMRLIHEKTVEREKAAGTYDENSRNPFQSVLEQDYDEYVANRKKEPVKKQITSDHDDVDPSVPFAVIDEVPIYPGCEDRGSNEANKNCMTDKITEFVTSNFNSGMGKELGLKGVNRIITVFTIDKDGAVTNIRARAPHPDLEVEAVRVISSLPLMTPGKQKGVAANVSYSLPISFEVNE